LINGAKATFPLEVGAVPFGIIFGALAVNSGISPAGTMGMSLFVYAGSAQFIAAGLVASGTCIALIIFTTFIVNLRHALYAATLSPHMKDLPQRWLLPLGFWLTDESFVVVAQRYYHRDDSPYKHWFYLGSALFMYANWQLMTLIGLIAGQNIEDPSRWGLQFALAATFIGILVPTITNRPIATAVFVAAVTAFVANPLPNRLGLILAALLGMLAGVLAERIWPDDVPDDEALPDLEDSDAVV